MGSGNRPERRRGEFFKVDSRNWREVTELGMNPAVAYLILANGTGRDNALTSWSTESVITYGGIGWKRAKEAIEILEQNGFILQTDSSTVARPRYELMKYVEQDSRPGFEEDASGETIIWLPNALVQGTIKGEEPPVKRVRSAGCLWTLRLLIDLYAAQNLRDDAGISPQVIRENFERKKIGERGAHTIWGFKYAQRTLTWIGPFAAHKKRKKESQEADHPAWTSVKQLERMGLLSFVPHIFENDTNDAEPLHPFGIGRRGELPIETDIGSAAQDAAFAMLPAHWTDRAACDGFERFCPILSTNPTAQLVGVARLTYRPHTGNVGAWYSRLMENGPTWIKAFRQMEENAPSFG
jgi:hypothetical protein